MYCSRADTEKAVEHFEAALGFASSFDWHDQLFWNNYSLAELFSDKGIFDEAHAHIERAKPHATNDPYLLGRATELQAGSWYSERRIEAAKLEALRAVELYENLGAAKYLWRSKMLLRWIEGEMGKGAVTPDKPDSEGSSFKTASVVLTLDLRLGNGTMAPTVTPTPQGRPSATIWSVFHQQILSSRLLKSFSSVHATNRLI